MWMDAQNCYSAEWYHNSGAHHMVTSWSTGNRKARKMLAKMLGVRVLGNSNISIQKAKIKQGICDSGLWELLICILTIGGKFANGGVSPTTTENCCQVYLSDQCIQWRNKDHLLTTSVKMTLDWGSHLFWKGLRQGQQNHDETVDVTWPQQVDLTAAYQLCCWSLKRDLGTQ